MKMNKYLILVSIVFFTGCSSEYQPNETMLLLKKDMTSESAKSVLQNLIWTEDGITSICAARGFWYDKNADMVVNEDNISMISYKRGKYLRSEGGGFGGKDYFEKEYYNYEFPFSKVNEVVIHKGSSQLAAYRGCTKHKGAMKYYVIDLFGNEKYNLKFMVFEEQFDETMAAITTLIQNKPVKVIKM